MIDVEHALRRRLGRGEAVPAGHVPAMIDVERALRRLLILDWRRNDVR